MAMGFNVEYKELKLWAKMAVGSMIVIIPIMFLDIFLFKKEFFNNSPLYINIIMAYGLVLPLFVLNTFWSWFRINTNVVKHEYSMYYGSALTLLFLLACTFLGWYNKWTFMLFLKVMFTLSFCLFILSFIISLPKEFMKQWRNR